MEKKRLIYLMAVLLIIGLCFTIFSYLNRQLKLRVVRDFELAFNKDITLYQRKNNFNKSLPLNAILKIDTAFLKYLESQIYNLDTNIIFRKRSLTKTINPNFVKETLAGASKNGGISAGNSFYKNNILFADKLIISIETQIDTSLLNSKSTLLNSNEILYLYEGPVQMNYKIYYNSIVYANAYYFFTEIVSPVRLKKQ